MSYQLRPGMHVIEIDTPALLLDLDAFERNISRMAQFFADKPTSLRPHAKTHKCPTIALRQLQAGAIGITCAKVGEAEVLVQAGVSDILIANQVVGPIKIDRLTDLARQCSMMVAIDHPANVDELSRACQAKGVSLRALVEVDIGMKRCGVQPGKAALPLARQIADAPGLQFAGLMGYEGHLVMLPDPDERASKVGEAVALLQETRDLLEKNGLDVPIVSGGGTGTYDMSGTCPPMTEIQAGSYVLMDATYLRIRPEFEPALSVLSTVISHPTRDRVITDTGKKAMSEEFGLPQPVGIEGLSLQALSEEHGKLTATAADSVSLRPGSKVRFLPSHCCTTVNLHDMLHVIQHNALVDIWPVAARGRAQ